MTHRTFRITIKPDANGGHTLEIPELLIKEHACTPLGARTKARNLIASLLSLTADEFDVVVDEPEEETPPPRASMKNRRLRLSELWMDL